MHVDLDTLATALYVKVDDELKASPQVNRWRPRVGIAPRITESLAATWSTCATSCSNDTASMRQP